MSFFRHNHKHDEHHHHDSPPPPPPPPHHPPHHPPQSSYPLQSSDPSQPSSYPPQSSYPPHSSYPSQPPYPPQQTYQPQPAHHHHPSPAGQFAGEPTVRIYTKAEEHYSLSVREGTVVLVPTNPRDEYQHWYKDFRWGTQVKDEEGLPAFALINKATGLAIKHALGPTHPVRLIPFNPEYLDESILWTESRDTGEGYRSIRMVNNIRLGFDAFHGDKGHGGVHDGTTVVLWEYLKGKNQRWKIVPFY